MNALGLHTWGVYAWKGRVGAWAIVSHHKTRVAALACLREGSEHRVRRTSVCGRAYAVRKGRRLVIWDRRA